MANEPPLTGHQRRREASLAKWRALDWTKTNVELAEDVGYRNSSPISRARRLLGARQSPHRYQRRACITDQRKNALLAKWRRWDWTKQDIELARETGLSKERIRRVRKFLGAPKSPHHGRQLARTRKWNPVLEWVTNHLDRLKGSTWDEVAQKCGIGKIARVHALLKEKGVLRDGLRFPLLSLGLDEF